MDIVFDIETGPLPEAELLPMIPEFDPTEVKVGNIKDPEKIAAKIKEAEETHYREATERAALDALTGRVIAFGVRVGGESVVQVFGHDDERVVLNAFWAACEGEMGRLNRLIGFNIGLFDLPFLVRRSWKHRIAIPALLRRGRYWSEQVVDLRDVWQLGDRQTRGSLDAVSKHLGLEGKIAGTSGAEFARLWATDREAAIAYLRRDVELTYATAVALGVL